MNRRAFVGALVAIGASLALPVRWAQALPRKIVGIAPRLWGDGVHDDTAALQWYIDHATPIPIHGDYFITRTLRVSPTGAMQMTASRLTGKRGVEPLIRIEPHADYALWGNTFTTSEGGGRAALSEPERKG